MNILADILYIAVVIYPGPGRFSGKFSLRKRERTVQSGDLGPG